jgi:ubiquitin-protein ligase
MKVLEGEMKDMPFITAAPMEENLFVWHGNLKGTEDNPYKGMIVHFEIRLPHNYPMSPPTISILTPLKHPNVFGNHLCLNMFDIGTKKVHKKWSTAYTLHSILLQLQSFLFDVKKSFFNKKNLALIQEQVEDSQDHECNTCGHRGSSKPHPAFPIYKKAEESNLTVNTFQSGTIFDEDQAFVEVRDEHGIYLDNVRCYHCKLDYKQTTIGFGVKSVKLPRTGDIKSCDPIVDYVCLHCFMKDGLYCSSTKELFNNWMPFFTEKSQWEKILKLARRSFSFIKTNSTKKFEPQVLINCIPKMLITMLYNMASKKKHPSINYIRVFVQIHAMFSKFLEIYPELRTEMEQQIAKFIESPENRTKGKMSSILKIPIYLLFTKKYKFEDIQEAFLEEDFARRIYWILAKIPNLDFNEEISHEHMIVAFKAAVESYRIILMLHHYSHMMAENFSSVTEFVSSFETNYGKLPNNIEDKVQMGLVKTFEVENYNEFFSYLGVSRTDEQIFDTLKTAYNLSAERGYHGNLKKAFETTKKEFTTHNFNVHNPSTLLEVYEKNNQSLDVSEEEAKQVLCDTFLWIRRTLYTRSNSQPSELANFSDEIKYNFNKVNHDLPDPLVIARNTFKSHYISSSDESLEVYPETFTWKELMVKLLFEQQIRSLEWEQDFPALHKTLSILKDFTFEGLVLYVIDISKIKMKYYYLTTLLKKINHVNHLIFRPSTNLSMIRVTLIKEIMKGFGSRTQFPCGVRFSGFNTRIAYSDDSVVLVETFVKIFEKLGAHLRYLTFQECSLLNYFPTSIPYWKYIMSNCSELERISIYDFHISNLTGFDDGIMNLRKLTHLRLQTMDSSSSNILENAIYNLNFTPTLKSLDFSNSYPKNQKLFFENISKLVKIAPNLVNLTLKNVSGLKNLFNSKFAEALGGNKYLQNLSLASLENVGSSAEHLGRAIAFNNRKKGSLKMVDMTGIVKSNTIFNFLIKGMNISNKDYEMVFGNVSIAQKMKNEDLKEVFEFGLDVLILDNSSTQNLEQKRFKQFILGINKQLSVLSLRNSKLNEKFFVNLNKVIKKNEGGESTLKYLDISTNSCLKGGNMTHLITYLMNQPQLEFLNLRNNHLGVAFPRKFMLMAGEWLKSNKLRFLDLGFNSLKIDGMYGLSPCVSQMTNLEWLDLTFNNLKDEGLRILSDELIKKKRTLDYLVFTNNFVSDFGFEKIIQNKSMGSLIKKAIFLRKNRISDHLLLENLPKISDVKSYDFFLDLTDKFFFLDQSLLERTVFVPVSIDPATVLRIFEKSKYKFLEDSSPGRVVSIRNRNIKSYFGKGSRDQFTFIEFSTPEEAERGRMLGSKGVVMINRKKRRVFIAGTSTFYLRKKKRNITKELITVIDNPRIGIPARGRPTRR